MNILICVLLILSVNLSQGNISDMKKDKMNMLRLTRDIGSNIKDFLEEFRKRMCHEIPNKNIPKLDPIGIDNFEFAIEQEMADLDIKVSNLSVSGLAKFDFPKLKISATTLKVEMELVLPKTVLITDYKVKGTIKDLFDLDGDGDMKLEINNFKLILVARLKFIAGKFSFYFEKLEFSIDEIKFRINNLFPDDDLNDFVSDMVSVIGVRMIYDLWEENGKDVQDIIETFVTDLLDGLTVKDLLEMLGNMGGFFDENDPKPNCTFDNFYLLQALRHAKLLY